MDLYADLVIEALKIYGQDVYYLPRDLVNEDVLLGDDPTSRFPTSHKIEMYIENNEGFDGEGDLYTRFGVEIRDEATFIVSRTRFSAQVRRPDNDIATDRPTEGDLIYLPLANKMFEIQHVEHEQPFYQIENLPVYKMRCTLFEYSGEDLDTGVEAIDVIERNLAQTITVNFATGGTGTFTVGEEIAGGKSNVTAEVKSWDSTNRQLQVYNRSGIFTIPETVTGQTSGAAWTTASYNTLNNTNSEFDANADFETLGDSIIDFSQSNPFGEIGGAS